MKQAELVLWMGCLVPSSLSSVGGRLLLSNRLETYIRIKSTCSRLLLGGGARNSGPVLKLDLADVLVDVG